MTADRAPSVLNGGLTNEWIIGTGVFSLVLGAVLELKGMELVRTCCVCECLDVCMCVWVVSVVCVCVCLCMGGRVCVCNVCM